MNLKDIHLLFDYNYWANQKILSRAAELSHEELTQPTPFSFGNLLQTLEHILDAEYVWRMICINNRFMGTLVDQETFPTLESLTSYWEQDEAEMRDYLHSLSDDNLDSIVSYTGVGGLRERVLWHCLVHIVNHGTQFRSESAAILSDFGNSPGDIDFVIFLDERT